MYVYVYLSLCSCVDMCVYVCVCVHVCMYLCVWKHIFVYIYVVCICVPVCVCVCVCVCVSLHGLFFSISSKCSFIYTIPQSGQHIPQPLLDQLWSTENHIDHCPGSV